MTKDILLVGCGDLGTRIGLEFKALDYRVTAIRRRAELLPASFRAVSADLANGLPDLPQMSGAGGGPNVLVVVLTAGARDAVAYRRVFVDEVGQVLERAHQLGWSPERAIFVSSTAVCAPAGSVDENTPARPTSETGNALLEAEQQFFAAFSDSTEAVVVRPSGIYGPGRTFFIDQVRSGQVRDPHRMTHRIHRDDVARAVVHLACASEPVESLYLLTDDAPVSAREVAQFLAQELHSRGESPKYAGDESDGEAEMPQANSHAGLRILSNRRLHASGFELTYPSFREGYQAILDGAGERYP